MRTILIFSVVAFILSYFLGFYLVAPKLFTQYEILTSAKRNDISAPTPGKIDTIKKHPKVEYLNFNNAILKEN